MSAQKQTKINLIPQRGFEATTVGRILAWILSTFRIIVIITELLVMVAFLSRFWLDAQNTDLTEEINQKQAVIAASLDFEKNFKNTQKRLKIFSDASSDGLIITNSLRNITSYLPIDVFLTSLSFRENTIEIVGSTPSERSIEQLTVNLEFSENFGNTQIAEVSTNPASPSLLDFRITTLIDKGN